MTTINTTTAEIYPVAKIETFFVSQQINPSSMTINRLQLLEQKIEQLTKEEEELDNKLVIVRYKKGEAISEFVENVPRGYWTNWIIYKMFGKIMLPSELSKEEKRKLETVRTKLDNYRTLFSTVNYFLAQKIKMDGEQITIEQFLETPQFAAIASSVWYKLGRNIEKIQREHFESIIRYIDEGNNFTLEDATNFQRIIRDPNQSPEEKKKLIESSLNKEKSLVIDSNIKTEASESIHNIIDIEVAPITPVNTPVTKKISTNTPVDSSQSNDVFETESVVVNPLDDKKIISVLKEEIENLIQKNETLLQAINRIKKELAEKELIVAQKEKDIEEYELTIYELQQQISSDKVVDKYKDKGYKELLLISQKSLTTEEDLIAIASAININTKFLSAKQIRREIQIFLSQKIEEEELYP